MFFAEQNQHDYINFRLEINGNNMVEIEKFHYQRPRRIALPEWLLTDSEAYEPFSL